MDELIRKYCLQNAVQHKGTCNPGSIIGKVLAEDASLKAKMKELAPKIQKIAKDVNNLSVEEQKKELEDIAPELLEKKKEKREFSLPELKNTKNVVLRFAPNPNGPMSFGHSRQALLNWWFAEKYEGTFLLRFDDTDPRTKIPMKEAYEWFEEDMAWLGIKVDDMFKQSDRFDAYYEYAEKIISMDKAYVCTCETEEKRKLLREKTTCPCREMSKEDTLERWKKMFAEDGYKDGEAILRIKTDLEAKDPAVRDWPAFRIITDGEHPLKKAKVWPLLNFSSAIDDHDFGITHIVRGIDLAVSDERQKYLYTILEWTYPETLYTGKLVVEGVKSTSESRKLIEAGKLEGWDDIRLATLKTLRKRGYVPEAIHAFVKSVGVNKNNVEVSLQNLEAFNKDVVDKTSERYFFIKDPVQITVKDAPKQEITLDLHPENKEGGRTFSTHETFYLDKEDVEKMKENDVIRLMGCLNMKKTKEGYVFHSLDHETFKKEGKMIIHWLPEKTEDVTVRMPDNTLAKGKAETTVKNIKKEQIIQFERFGFCRKNEDFWYTHE